MALGRKTGGRKKGSQNKMTKTVKQMILDALDEAGGVDYLVDQAKENPTAFMTLVGRILPTEISGPDGGPIRVKEILEDINGRSTGLPSYQGETLQ